MFYRHHADKLIYPIIVLFFFLMVSYRPKFHLNSKMPTTFFSDTGSDRLHPAENDKKIAWAYWESALMDIQWKYSRNSSLPPDPPPEFRVHVKALGSAVSDEELRVTYWHRLQTVWSSPDAWTSDYHFDFEWIRDPVDGIEDWVRDLSHRFSIPGH